MVRANIDVIDKLLTIIEKDIREEFRESTKKEPIYIIVDYYDWLEYMDEVKDKKKIEYIYGPSFFSSIYRDCRKIIELTDKKLNVRRSGTLFSDYDRDELEILLEGYYYFVRELENIQIKFIENYVYNNNNYPRVIIPFSFGINRMATEHYLLEESNREGKGYSESVLYEYNIQDRCTRVGANLLGNKAVICTLRHTLNTDRLILPKSWRIKSNKDETESANVRNKLTALNVSYMNYHNIGMKHDSFLEEKYGKAFFLNNPFVCKESLYKDIGNIKEVGDYEVIGRYPM